MSAENLHFGISFSSYYFIPIALLLLLFTIYIYKVTVPQINKGLKVFLIALRSLTLFLILIALFDPVLKLTREFNLPPKVAVFIDNSQSVNKYSKKIFSNASSLSKKLLSAGLDVRTYGFGSTVTSLPKDSLDKLNFNERLTSFDLVFDSLQNISDLDAAVIFSDGNITVGSTPINRAEKSEVKIFTIGVGDTTKPADIEIAKVLSNSFAYLNKKTEVQITLKNKGFGDVTLPVSLFDGNKQVAVQSVFLANDGLLNLKLTFTPKTLGERRLRVSIPNIKGDSKKGNNSKYFYLKVLDSKIKVALVCGAPSADFSFVKNSLSQNKEFRVTPIVELSPNKTINGNRAKAILDSSKVLFLIGFPARNSKQKLIDLVKKEIVNKKKPYLLLFSLGTDFSKLAHLGKGLNFRINQQASVNVKANISVNDFNDPLFKLTQGNEESYWSNLPPLNFYGINITPLKPARVAAEAILNNRKTVFPFVIKYSNAQRRSLSLPVGNIWRWKLRPSTEASLLFDDFFQNCAKWLNAANNLQRFKLRPAKKIFVKGEPVYFKGEVYDESLNPLNNADVEITVKQDGENFQTVLVNKNNGLYEGYFENLKAGEYSYTGKIFVDGKQAFSKSGKFTITTVNPELLKTDINTDFLKLISNLSGGKYFPIEKTNRLISYLKSELGKKEKTKIHTGNYPLRSYPMLLIVIIFLFTLEWVIRKRSGLM